MRFSIVLNRDFDRALAALITDPLSVSADCAEEFIVEHDFPNGSTKRNDEVEIPSSRLIAAFWRMDSNL